MIPPKFPGLEAHNKTFVSPCTMKQIEPRGVTVLTPIVLVNAHTSKLISEMGGTHFLLPLPSGVADYVSLCVGEVTEVRGGGGGGGALRYRMATHCQTVMQSRSGYRQHIGQ